MEEIEGRNGGKLKPFKKGEDERRNKNGRGKGVPNSKTRLMRLLEITQEKENKLTGDVEEFSVAEQMDMALIVKALNGDIVAYKEIIDRLEGKATNNVDVKTGGETLNTVTFKIIHSAGEISQ